MKLYLVRHGDAKPKEQDPDRHLSDQGVGDIEKVAAFLAPLGLRVGAVWHSGKPRARDTAEILAPAFAADANVVQHKGLAPNDPVAPIVKQVARPDHDLVMVGHLPFMATLATALLAPGRADDLIAFEKGGVLCLERDQAASWQVRWMLVPTLLP